MFPKCANPRPGMGKLPAEGIYVLEINKTQDCSKCSSKSTWILADDFTWAHFIFLLSCLLMLEKYDLVPSALRCPPFYIVYKVIAAIVLANAALFTIWYQVEDILFWFINEICSLLEYIPGVGKMEYQKTDNLVTAIQTIATVYLLLWVIVSSGFISQISGSSKSGRESTMNQRSSKWGRKCRSGRC